jgi:hypothetical protein
LVGKKEEEAVRRSMSLERNDADEENDLAVNGLLNLSGYSEDSQQTLIKPKA